MLIDKLPINTPYALLIDPSNACNFKCKFCPTGYPEIRKKFNVPVGVMDMQLFEKIVDDLVSFEGKVKTIHLNKDGEPLLNKNLAKMISLLVEKDVVEKIQVTSNLEKLNDPIAIDLIHSNLDVLRVSVEHVNDIGYQNITQTKTTYNEILEKVKFIFDLKTKRNSKLKIVAKLNNTGVTKKEIDNFIKDFKICSDEIDVWELHKWNLVDDVDFSLGNNNKIQIERNICQYIFYMLAINYNGVVSACCADWSMTLPVGDCKEESLKSIWNGDKLYQIRMTHINGQRNSIEICSKCDYFKNNGDVSDETLLDPYQKELNNIYSRG